MDLLTKKGIETSKTDTIPYKEKEIRTILFASIITIAILIMKIIFEAFKNGIYQVVYFFDKIFFSLNDFEKLISIDILDAMSRGIGRGLALYLLSLPFRKSRIRNFKETNSVIESYIIINLINLGFILSTYSSYYGLKSDAAYNWIMNPHGYDEIVYITLILFNKLILDVSNLESMLILSINMFTLTGIIFICRKYLNKKKDFKTLKYILIGLSFILLSFTGQSIFTNALFLCITFTLFDMNKKQDIKKP